MLTVPRIIRLALVQMPLALLQTKVRYMPTLKRSGLSDYILMVLDGCWALRPKPITVTWGKGARNGVNPVHYTAATQMVLNECKRGNYTVHHIWIATKTSVSS